MADRSDEVEPVPPSENVDDLPTITCSQCDREWDLAYELEDLRVGNQAVEQFALDHKRHTGHFPDDVMPWVAGCRQCPDGDEFLSEYPARRWAEVHARHTRHDVAIHHSSKDDPIVVEPGLDGL